MTREEAKELLIHVLMTYVPRDQYGDLDDPKPYEEAMTMAIEALSEPKTGEWVWSDEDASWTCGCCDCVFEEIDWKPNYNFCPNCGARMNGGEEE